jgi:hypothetical protein
MVISARDQTVLAAPALNAARRAWAGEVLQVDGMQYAAFLNQHGAVVAAELDFLRRHLLHDGPGEDQTAPPSVELRQAKHFGESHIGSDFLLQVAGRCTVVGDYGPLTTSALPAEADGHPGMTVVVYWYDYEAGCELARRTG